MKSTALVCALAAAALGCGSLSYGQGRDRAQDRDGRSGYEARDGGQERGRSDRGDRSQQRRPAASGERQGPPRAQWGQQNQVPPQPQWGQQRQMPAPPQWGQQRHDGVRGQQPAPQYARPDEGRRWGASPGGAVQAVPPQRQYGQPAPNLGYLVPPQPQPQPQWQSRDEGRGPQRGGWNQAPRFHTGDYLPPEYRQRQYYVNDWRAHRLYAPPPGHQWVQVETGDYLLIALGTGIIANLLLGQ